MEIYRVALFGHRDFDGHKVVEEKLCKIIPEITRRNQLVEIFIGREGEFDIFAASIIKGLKRRGMLENTELTLVLPYHKKDIEYYEKYYDNLIIPEVAERTHPKGAIVKLNRYILEISDLVICYVEHNYGGAFDAFKYAQQKGKTVVNLAEKVNFN